MLINCEHSFRMARCRHNFTPEEVARMLLDSNSGEDSDQEGSCASSDNDESDAAFYKF